MKKYVISASRPEQFPIFPNLQFLMHFVKENVSILSQTSNYMQI